jgi:hypothetical protein
MNHNVYAGEARFPRGRRFKPTGPLIPGEESMPMELARREPLSRLAARFFVGLNVGTETKWTERDVIDAVVRIRRAQGASPGASIMSQRGIYEDQSKRIIDEPSVQIIIIDFDGTAQETFTGEMIALGESLTRELQQETILLEIQKRGIVEDQYTLTPD